MERLEPLSDAIDTFVETVADADLTAVVPTCPDWTLAGLVDHLREVHWWAAHAITGGDPKGQAPPVGLDRDALITGYVTAADRLLAALGDAAPHAPAWTFGTDRTVEFWRRRQVHEVTLHLFDALAAQGRPDEWTITPELAWDGVEEVAGVFYPRQVKLERTAPLAGTLRVEAVDLDETLDLGTGEPYGVLAGPAAQVLLALWNRAPVEDPAAKALLDEAAIVP